MEEVLWRAGATANKEAEAAIPETFCTVQLEKKTKMLFDLVGKNVPAKLIHHSSRYL